MKKIQKLVVAGLLVWGGNIFAQGVQYIGVFATYHSFQPGEKNGLQKPSQVMIDKAMTVKRDKLGKTFGAAGDEAMLEVGRCLAVFLGIAR